MVGQTKPEGISQRFSEHIGELREFFGSRGVPFGNAEDVSTFARHLAEDPSFHEEMGSMVRSILYEEDERLGRGELLELVTAAVGGPAVDSAIADLQPSIRQIFLFLNAAIRQGHTSFGEEPKSGVAEPAQELPVPSVLPLQATREMPPPEIVPVPETRRAAGNEVLFRAMSLSAEQETDPVKRARAPIARIESEPRERGPWWAIPAVGLVLAALGAGMYVGRPLVERHWKPDASATGATQAPVAAPSSCVAPIATGVTRSGLEERSKWAHNLLEQRLYEAALPELRDIARLDPGYPGIKLDESDALLNLKRPEDAREAVDAQIGVSECLAKLPGTALDTYCSAQFSIASVAGCRAQLTHIRQAAELQAALVHLELGHRVQPDADAAAAIAELTSEKSTPTPGPKPSRPPAVASQAKARREEPLPAATEGDAAQPPIPRAPAVRATGKKGKGDPSLVQGEGTDSAYGAYQKPE